MNKLILTIIVLFVLIVIVQMSKDSFGAVPMATILISGDPNAVNFVKMKRTGTPDVVSLTGDYTPYQVTNTGTMFFYVPNSDGSIPNCNGKADTQRCDNVFNISASRFPLNVYKSFQITYDPNTKVIDWNNVCYTNGRGC